MIQGLLVRHAKFTHVLELERTILQFAHHTENVPVWIIVHATLVTYRRTVAFKLVLELERTNLQCVHPTEFVKIRTNVNVIQDIYQRIAAFIHALELEHTRPLLALHMENALN